jgi:hypothetical protein
MGRIARMSTPPKWRSSHPSIMYHLLACVSSLCSTSFAACFVQYNMAYLIMTLLGAGLLFPYNTLLSAADYWQAHYPSANLLFWIPLVMNISSPPIMGLMVKYGARMSFVRRMVIWFTLEAVLVVGRWLAWLGFVSFIACDELHSHVFV